MLYHLVCWHATLETLQNVKSYCPFEAIAQRFKNYKLRRNFSQKHALVWCMLLSSLLKRVLCVPAWYTWSRANVPKACQLLIFTCQFFNLVRQRARDVSIVQLGVPIFQLCLPKAVPIFQLFFKRIFQFMIFSIILNICKFQKYLSNCRETKNLNFDICKISLSKNLINLKPLTLWKKVYLEKHTSCTPLSCCYFRNYSARKHTHKKRKET